MRLVDLGFHDDSALSSIHTTMNGAEDVYLELPLLTFEVAEKGPHQLSNAAVPRWHHALQAHD